ncbi:MAG TPA: LysM peptidoglycan-binding domain-containing protein [Candidatus Saccharimonadales bacterium]|nr:LysM peptidoglycan-binding domain-containing protein [Candidatus Saccharimonadales bacterium]
MSAPASARSGSFYKRWQVKIRRQSVRRRAIGAAIVMTNVIIVGLILTIVIQSQKTTTTAKSVASATSENTVNPADQLSSADIAQTIAQLNGLPETTAITNQAQSKAAEVALAPSTDNVVSEPQVISTALKSRSDIQTYTAKANDTVSSLAATFGVTSDSIRWSNNMSGEAIAAGTKLLIPPVNGIIYTVKAGDTPASLAARFNANQDQIIAYNDAEVTGLTPGEQIILPNAVEGGGQTARQVSSGFAWGSNPIYGINGYDYGYCTWYVATQVPVPANWGNASTWAIYARYSGWNVSKGPSNGAIAQVGGGEGHVALVDDVSPDGTMIRYRDMNGLAGWGRVGQSGWVPASHFANYISH